VIDKRAYTSSLQEGYDANDLSGYIEDYTDITPAGDISYIFPNFLVSRQTYDDDQDQEWNINSGFFFFDYEKALYTDTVLSKTYDISRIESWFGQELTNYGLMFEQVSTERHGEDSYHFSQGDVDDGQKIGRIAAYGWNPQEREIDSAITAHWGHVAYEREFPLKYGRISDSEFSADTHYDIFLPITENGFHSTGTTDTDYSYLYNLPFNFASSVSLGDYRMACFYFQDYWKKDLNYNDLGASYYTSEWYKTKIKLEDNSSHIPLELMRDFASAYGQLLGYLDGAEDNCSYDNINGYFNEFFVTVMNEKYKEDMTQAPWNRAVTTLYLHMDLVENMFGQNYTALVDAAKKQIARINPETGTLEQLRDFKDDMKVFWDTYYALGTGVMGALIDAHPALNPVFQDSENAEQYLSYLPNSAPSDSALVLGPTEPLEPLEIEYVAASDVLPPVYTELTIPECEDGSYWDEHQQKCMQIPTIRRWEKMAFESFKINYDKRFGSNDVDALRAALKSDMQIDHDSLEWYQFARDISSWVTRRDGGRDDVDDALHGGPEYETLYKTTTACKDWIAANPHATDENAFGLGNEYIYACGALKDDGTGNAGTWPGEAQDGDIKLELKNDEHPENGDEAYLFVGPIYRYTIEPEW